VPTFRFSPPEGEPGGKQRRMASSDNLGWSAPAAVRPARLTDDPYLAPYRAVLARRAELADRRARELAPPSGSLAEFARAHEHYGLHRRDGRWVFREWAPHAAEIRLVGDFSDWQERPAFELRRLPEGGDWEGEWPAGTFRHGQRYHLAVRWESGGGERLPAYARRVVQDAGTRLFHAQVWAPPEPYRWRQPAWRVPPRAPLIYEAHVGLAREQAGIGTYEEFRRQVLPRVAAGGYNTLQLMAVMEHPDHASFGYQVGSFFAASSRFGTPEELKALVDDAHVAGLAVTMDLIHSHAVRHEREGLSRFDGADHLYFHEGSRGWHEVWDARCFDYGKTEVLRFLLSNCRFWLEEYRFDGFRFHGITSMLYLHHGIGVSFGDYSLYFDDLVDEDALVYCSLANRLIREMRPDALTIAEEVSGMPGLAAPPAEGGVGFGYRLAPGVPDCWFKLVREARDEDWNLGYLWHELTRRRDDERTINYAESRDQALGGGKTLLSRMLDAAVYDAMHRGARNPATDRAVALHKLIRLATLATAGHGYLNFMGNEFGHPDWPELPPADGESLLRRFRRQWHLRDDPGLFFHCLGEFDAAMLACFASRRALETAAPRLVLADDAGKLLVLVRGDLIVAVNFHASHSAASYPLRVPAGRYRGVLNSDSVIYGGQGRIAEKQEYPVTEVIGATGRATCIHIYLPARTALVMERLAATRT
jgi:1,4-alpha-glucan branching enzyme